jgi:hypothetical protein
MGAFSGRLMVGQLDGFSSILPGSKNHSIEAGGLVRE